MSRGLCERFRCAWRELVRSEEPTGPLLPYARLIVICGMPRTGTSALAAYVGSHPDVRLVVGDDYWQKCESNLVRDGDIKWGLLHTVMEKLEPWRVLVKQPWLEGNVEFHRWTQGARRIVTFRDKEDMFDSWHRTWTAGKFGRENPEELYQQRIGDSRKLVESGALGLNMSEFGSHLAGRLGEYLDLDPSGFDADVIRRRWREAEERQWVVENAVWQPAK